MASPWAAPFPAGVSSTAKKKAQVHLRPEAFAAHEAVGTLDGLLTEALLPILGERIVRDPRLEQRGVADIVEKTLKNRLVAAARERGLKAFPAKSKRSMEDVRFEIGDAEIKLDVKSRNVGLDFSMPNLVAIERLDEYYLKGTNVFMLLIAEYRETEESIEILDLHWMRAEEICWSCLSIQNIGRGQLQLTNAKNRLRRFEGNRSEWQRRLRSEASGFFHRLIEKAIRSKAEWQARAWECEGE